MTPPGEWNRARPGRKAGRCACAGRAPWRLGGSAPRVCGKGSGLLPSLSLGSRLRGTRLQSPDPSRRLPKGPGEWGPPLRGARWSTPRRFPGLGPRPPPRIVRLPGRATLRSQPPKPTPERNGAPVCARLFKLPAKGPPSRAASQTGPPPRARAAGKGGGRPASQVQLVLRGA